MSKPEVIGILGGTFDPIHCGHLNIAKYCAAKFNMDKLIFIPCHIPTHRATPEANSEQRLAMVELAVSELEHAEVDTFEMQRGEGSYSYNTLEYLRNKYPEANLAFILGMDSFSSFNTWQNYGKILELCNLVVVNRPGYQLPEADWSKQLLQQHRCTDIADFCLHTNGKIFTAQIPPQQVSATNIRNTIKQQCGGRINVPTVVKNYMDQHNLYQYNIDKGSKMMDMQQVQALLDAEKAEDIKIIDVRDLTDVTDFMVICTARSTRHASAISRNISAKLQELGHKAFSIEGGGQDDWILLDYSDCVIHIMLEQTREFYSLEKLWSVTSSQREQSGVE